jgi:hypothetical protein
MQYPGLTQHSYPLTAAAETGSGYTVSITILHNVIMISHKNIMPHFNYVLLPKLKQSSHRQYNKDTLAQRNKIYHQ